MTINCLSCTDMKLGEQVARRLLGLQKDELWTD